MDFYRAMTKDLMNIAEDENETFDDDEEYEKDGEEKF